MFGLSYATAKIRVSDSFAFDFKLPETMVKGDTHNITMKISNFNPTWTVYSPSVVDADESLAVSFDQLVKNTTGTNMVSTKTYNVSANSTTFTAVFTVTALKPTKRATLKIMLTGTSPDGNHTFEEVVEQSTKIASLGTIRTIQSAGNLAVINGSEASSPSSQTFSFKMPKAEYFNTTKAVIKVFPGAEAYV